MKWKIIIGLAVFAAGFAAAMFFRRGETPAPAPAPEVASQPPRELPRLVPLRVSAEGGESPAAETLAPRFAAKPELVPVESPLWQPGKTDFDPELDAPPEIGPRYAPLPDPLGFAADPALAPVSPGSATPKTLRRYTLRDGDTLAKLAAKYLGSAARAGEIYAANRTVLTSGPDLLPLGEVIILPGVLAEEP